MDVHPLTPERCGDLAALFAEGATEGVLVPSRCWHQQHLTPTMTAIAPAVRRGEPGTVNDRGRQRVRDAGIDTSRLQDKDPSGGSSTWTR
jgi:hypothetical protein